MRYPISEIAVMTDCFATGTDVMRQPSIVMSCVAPATPRATENAAVFGASAFSCRRRTARSGAPR
jgi:hypothetical protein